MTTLRRWILVGVVLGGVAVGAAGCGGDDGADAASRPEPSAKTVRAGSAAIDTLEVPEHAECNGATSATVSVTYATSDAARVELRVDGRDIPLEGKKSGKATTDIRCDPLPHDFVLLAYDGSGGVTEQTRLLNTNP